ncbi:MAG: hypothetical protein UU10_C0033G0010 [Parcubacteria group bacterium GW2011_GWF1_40_6]|nr:MAG: hypothetical protein UU10_C0033G0010 [Parcubacteria group bacterium GW2011_GWF1_40_6]
MKIEFSKLFKKEKNFKKKDFVLDALFYWKLAVGGAFVLIIASFIFGYLLFSKINTEPDLLNLNETEQIPIIDQDRMLRVFEIFQKREAETIEILNSPVPVVDPSL